MDTARIITEEGLERYQRYYSIYRGIVVDNKDEGTSEWFDGI